MLVVLSADPALQNPWQRLLKQSVIREEKALGESLMLLHPGQKPNWKKLARKLGRYASRLVLSEHITLPAERPWKAMDNSVLKAKILSNTLCSFSEQLDWVGLYDPDGRHTVMAWELAQMYPRVSVWCRFRERYSALCNDLMEQLGAVIELTERWDGLMDCPLIGSTEPPPLLLRWSGTMLLTEKAELAPLCGSLLPELRLPIPAELLLCCPMDVDPQELYLSILHQQRRELSELCYLLPENPLSFGESETFSDIK